MDDLPIVKPVVSPVPPITPINPVGNMAKESSPIVSTNEAPLVSEIGKEELLSTEVKNAGVRMQSDTIELPAIAHSMGVKIVDTTSPPVAIPLTVTLPLTDEQIAKGLHQSIVSSWRWLAQWCERQLKHIVRTKKT